MAEYSKITEEEYPEDKRHEVCHNTLYLFGIKIYNKIMLKYNRFCTSKNG